MDLISGISVSALGHQHPKIQAAITQQAHRYEHVMVYGECLLPIQQAFASTIIETLPENLHSVYLTNSGSEAIEGAMKLAKRFTGRRELIALEQAYHGSTHGALSLTGNEDLKQAYRPLVPHIRHIPLNNLDAIQSISRQTAAVFIEPIQAEAGLREAKPSYVKALARRCQEVGAMLVFDEVQTGFGRCGTFWRLEALGVKPDILVTAKALGGGLPLGAFIANKTSMDTLASHPMFGHITTCGGHPLSCAAGLATCQVIEEEKLVDAVTKKGKMLYQALNTHPAIKEIRIHGLWLAIELASQAQASQALSYCLDESLFVDTFLFCPQAIRICPPLNITENELQIAASGIKRALNRL